MAFFKTGRSRRLAKQITLGALLLGLVSIGSDVRLAFGTDGNGGATRTWVSGVGDDANPCSRTAPCKTFAGAISKTAQPGGEIDALDPGGFGAVTITGGTTINGGKGNVAGVLVAGTNGIVVAAAANDTVILRNLDINGTDSGLSGVVFQSGKALYIEDSTIENFTVDGVQVSPSAGGTVVLKNDVIRNDTQSGVLAAAGSAPVNVVIQNCTIQGNGNGVVAGVNGSASSPTNVDIQGNTISGNGHGLMTLSQGTITSFGGNLVDMNAVNGAPSVTRPTV